MDDESKILFSRLASAIEKMGDDLGKTSATVSRNATDNSRQSDTNSAHNLFSGQKLAAGMSALGGSETATAGLLKSIPLVGPALGATAGAFTGGTVYQEGHAKVMENMQEVARQAGAANIRLSSQQVEEMQKFYLQSGRSTIANLREVDRKQSILPQSITDLMYDAQVGGMKLLGKNIDIETVDQMNESFRQNKAMQKKEYEGK